MERVLLHKLIKWRDGHLKMPILLRGARQVGKTYLVEYFGRTYFDNLISINLEQEEQYHACFQTLMPEDIINRIELLSAQSIVPKKTLLFLDEIQTCPRAIMALRYFKEQMPELHVIAAGSLLEFALRDDSISMPVGRIMYLYMKPLSFIEYLEASGNYRLTEFLQQVTLESDIPDVIHDQLLKLVREYMIVGGMPDVVDNYVSHHRLVDTQLLQTIILRTYKDDFAKYAKFAQHKYLQLVYEKAPGLIGDQVKYSKISADMHSRDLKSAITDLEYANVIKKINSTAASGLPLNIHVNEKRFKLLFLDIGLANRASNVDISLLLDEDFTFLTDGALAEQFVGQELLAYQDPFDEPQLYFWAREVKSSKAEVDYVINIGSQIIPIEVKAGKTGSLRSLHLFLEEKGCPFGVRISAKKLSRHNNVLSIPFYLIGELSRLLQTS